MPRPKRNVNASVQKVDEVTSAVQSDSGDVSEAVVSRPKRPPAIASRNRLTVPGLNHDKFHYHWFNDVDDNIPTRLSEGYTFVTKDGTEVGDRDANYSQSPSSYHVKPVGMGIKAYLMCIPKEWWIWRQAETSQKDAQERDDYIKEKVKSAKGLHGNVRTTVK